VAGTGAAACADAPGVEHNGRGGGGWSNSDVLGAEKWWPAASTDAPGVDRLWKADMRPGPISSDGGGKGGRA
jgi:hypothetical protein